MTTARRTGATSLTTLAASMAAFIGLHLFAPQWARSAGLDFWHAARDAELQQEAKERSREIDSGAERLAQQISAADTIATAVIEDRLAFDVAVDQIAEINRDRSGMPEALRSGDMFHAPERELWERYLMDKVRSKLEDDPSRQAEVLTRLTCR